MSKSSAAKGPKRIPEGCHGVIPHLIVSDGNRAIEFYKKAFGAKELLRMPGPDGRSIGHAHLQIGGGALYLCDEVPAMNCRAPTSIGGTPVSMHIYVDDVDSAFARAVEAGTTVTMPLMNMFWGDRFGKVRDPFGHEWSLASHVEDVSPAEMQERGKAAFAAMANSPPQ
jgi:PhnB protein